MTTRCPDGNCEDARGRGECIKCGLPLLPPAPSPEEVERFFGRLREYVAAAEGQAGPAFDIFLNAALTRLRRGAEEHGERNFLRAGVVPIHEALEEAADGPNWILGAMCRDPERWDSPALWGAAYRFIQAHRDLILALHEEP